MNVVTVIANSGNLAIKFVVNTASNIALGFPVILNRVSVGSWALFNAGDAGHCSADFTCGNTINGYQYNPADDKWYAGTPNPSVGIWGWSSPASPEMQAQLNSFRDATIAHNQGTIDRINDNSQQTWSTATITQSSSNTSVVTYFDENSVATESVVVYTLQPGDNPSKIDALFGLPQGTVMRMNNIPDPTKMPIGSQIVIPISKPGNNTEFAPDGVTVGENQFLIDGAFQYDVQTVAFFTGVSEAALIAANPGVDFSRLAAGRILNLPATINTVQISVTPEQSNPLNLSPRCMKCCWIVVE